MKVLISALSDIKRLVIDINSFPIGRRIGGYVILLIALFALLTSTFVCVLGLWGLIESVLDGSFPPYIDPEESEWDIR